MEHQCEGRHVERGRGQQLLPESDLRGGSREPDDLDGLETGQGRCQQHQLHIQETHGSLGSLPDGQQVAHAGIDGAEREVHPERLRAEQRRAEFREDVREGFWRQRAERVYCRGCRQLDEEGSGKHHRDEREDNHRV